MAPFYSSRAVRMPDEVVTYDDGPPGGMSRIRRHYI
jgi:hypothetical protein